MLECLESRCGFASLFYLLFIFYRNVNIQLILYKQSSASGMPNSVKTANAKNIFLLLSQGVWAKDENGNLKKLGKKKPPAVQNLQSDVFN
jgi:hypothetical protein